jgi:hypothetical protein
MQPIKLLRIVGNNTPVNTVSHRRSELSPTPLWDNKTLEFLRLNKYTLLEEFPLYFVVTLVWVVLITLNTFEFIYTAKWFLLAAFKKFSNQTSCGFCVIAPISNVNLVWHQQGSKYPNEIKIHSVLSNNNYFMRNKIKGDDRRSVSFWASCICSYWKWTPATS